MKYQVSGLKSDPFIHLYGQSDTYLKQHGVIRVKVDKDLGYPDRISLCDIPAGNNALLLNHIYQAAKTPYFGCHAIFVWEGHTGQGLYINELPQVMTSRLLSLRAFDEDHLLVRADVCEGSDAERIIYAFFNDPAVSYIQVHHAKRGCYSCHIERG